MARFVGSRSKIPVPESGSSSESSTHLHKSAREPNPKSEMKRTWKTNNKPSS